MYRPTKGDGFRAVYPLPGRAEPGNMDDVRIKVIQHLVDQAPQGSRYSVAEAGVLWYSLEKRLRQIPQLQDHEFSKNVVLALSSSPSDVQALINGGTPAELLLALAISGQTHVTLEAVLACKVKPVSADLELAVALSKMPTFSRLLEAGAIPSSALLLELAALDRSLPDKALHDAIKSFFCAKPVVTELTDESGFQVMIEHYNEMADKDKAVFLDALASNRRFDCISVLCCLPGHPGQTWRTYLIARQMIFPLIDLNEARAAACVLDVLKTDDDMLTAMEESKYRAASAGSSERYNLYATRWLDLMKRAVSKDAVYAFKELLPAYVVSTDAHNVGALAAVIAKEYPVSIVRALTGIIQALDDSLTQIPTARRLLGAPHCTALMNQAYRHDDVHTMCALADIGAEKNMAYLTSPVGVKNEKQRDTLYKALFEHGWRSTLPFLASQCKQVYHRGKTSALFCAKFIDPEEWKDTAALLEMYRESTAKNRYPADSMFHSIFAAHRPDLCSRVEKESPLPLKFLTSTCVCSMCLERDGMEEIAENPDNAAQ